MSRALVAAAFLLTVAPLAWAQPGVLTKQHLIEYTPDWKGERFPDGRPKVPDAILDRMKHVTLEEAWAVVTGAGFSHQYDDSWLSIHPGAGAGRPRAHITVAARPARHPARHRSEGAAGRTRRRDQRVAGGHASAARRLRLRSLRPQGERGVRRRQRRQRHLREDRQRHRLRRRRARHQWPARHRALHLVRPLLRPVAPHRQRQRGSAPQLDDDRHQRADPDRRRSSCRATWCSAATAA